MAYKDVAKNTMLTSLTALITHVSAHTGFPATISAGNEVTGGSYARQGLGTWGTAASGSISKGAGNPVIPIPAGTTVASIGLCSASTAGTLYADADVTDETFGSAGTYTLTGLTLDLNA